MKNNSTTQNVVITKTMKKRQVTVPRLSDNAFYLIALACELKKLLGAASLQHFIATGESVLFTKKAS